MAHGGPRNGAGRPKGAASRIDREAREKAAESGLLPLDYMLEILRDERRDTDTRFEAAKAAAPYLHAKLASVEHSGPDGGAIKTKVAVSFNDETIDRVSRRLLGEE